MFGIAPKWWAGVLLLLVVASLLCQAAQGVLVGSEIRDTLNADVETNATTLPQQIWNIAYGSVTWTRYDVLNDGSTIAFFARTALQIITLIFLIPVAIAIVAFIKNLFSPFSSV